ncbi:MAG: division/outer membrane stress-associated lipid-binding lipoprotein [Gammaproteobacteria bacterium]
MRSRTYSVLLLFCTCLCLQGCAAVIVGGAATGAAVAHDSRTTGTVVDDEAIELKAGHAIRRDEQLRRQTHINFTSYNNMVLVSGEAPTEELKKRAIERIRGIPKVRRVYDEITIAAPSSLTSRSSDTLLTASVKGKLLTIRNFDGTRIKVVTEKGVVFLMGLVTRREGGIAAEASRQVSGVQKVVKLFEYTDPAG